ncbi:MAG TPA: pyridoxamine 5'-phosphate oxidase family protein [Terriglobales bacterium]|nr:pyridoxamine 5'-phosphate oxidase family protein [Terriglobales bacterium]
MRKKILRNSATSSRKALPSASRPLMPGYGIKGPKEGTGLLPWKWAQEHLEKAHNFWVASTRPDGRPHVMPVWAVWMEDALYFSTGAKSRKARNLRANPACVVCAEHARGQIVIEGTAKRLSDSKLWKRFARVYEKKYDFDMSGYSAEPLYVVRPQTVFGLWEKDFLGSATRWNFGSR